MTDELGLLEFVIQRPLGADVLQRHVDYACARGLREANVPGRLDIIANGPSASKVMWSQVGKVMVLNGALDLCLRHWGHPDYWAGIDPQELVVDFLDNIPYEGITYLVASQCHPAVFERLRGQDVRLLHILDGVTLPEGANPIPTGTSVTLTMLMNAPRLTGCWDIHVWGWDCCMDGPLHHASGPSALPLGMELRELHHVERDTNKILRTFTTCATWAHEAQQSIHAVQFLRNLGASVTVHGDGLVRHTLDFHASLEPSTCPYALCPMGPTKSNLPEGTSSS